MNAGKLLGRVATTALLALAAGAAQAQLDYSAYGVLDLSYGRFENSGLVREHRFNSNSLSATFVGVEAKYGLDGGFTPGITLETFLRFQDGATGRTSADPFFSRKAFVSLASPYGNVAVGRLQTLLFDTTTRFNALGNSTGFSPAIRHVFLSGNLEGVQGDFYWNEGVSYVSPNIFGVTASAMYARRATKQDGDLVGTSIVYSRGLFAAALSAQRVHFDNGIDDRTQETTWQLGATYNFGWARVFGLYTTTDDDGLDVKSRLASAGVAVPAGPGTIALQAGRTKATGPAVDRKHTTVSAAYIYPYNSVTDIYLIGMDDRVRGQTKGNSIAAGVRFRF